MSRSVLGLIIAPTLTLALALGFLTPNADAQCAGSDNGYDAEINVGLLGRNAAIRIDVRSAICGGTGQFLRLANTDDFVNFIICGNNHFAQPVFTATWEALSSCCYPPFGNCDFFVLYRVS